MQKEKLASLVGNEGKLRNMELVKRILNIRKHKTIIFADILDENFNVVQLKISRDLFNEHCISCGDVVCVNAEETKNSRNQKVYVVTEIQKVMKPKGKNSYKQMTSEDDIYAQTLNGGLNLKHWEFKNRLIMEINDYLLAKKFMRIITSNIMDKRGTSIVNPVKLSGSYVNNKYLKITHELEIKKQVYLTLKSLFEIGYVARDVYSTNKSFFEYLNLELVSVDTNTDFLVSFYEFVNNVSKKIAKELKIEYNSVFDNLSIIDVLGEYKKKYFIFDYRLYNEFYQMLKEKYPNCIFINVIANNPLIKKTFDEKQVEIKWIINNASVGHGYEDENNVDIIISAFNKQKQELLMNNIEASMQDDYVQVLMDAGIDTMSLNLGIDRFICKFLNYKNIKKSYKILGV